MLPNAILHLHWLNQRAQSGFIPDGGLVIDNTRTGGGRAIPYYETMVGLYSSEVWIQSPYGELLAERQLRDDMKYQKKLADDLKKKMASVKVIDYKQWFVTIGFKKDIKPNQMVPIIETIMSYAWVWKLKGVIELHGKEGYRPHMHLNITCDSSIYKSKVIEKLYAVDGIKKICLGKNNIQCDPYKDGHDAYVEGNKQEKKMILVGQDHSLRESLGIPHLFEK